MAKLAITNVPIFQEMDLFYENLSGHGFSSVMKNEEIQMALTSLLAWLMWLEIGRSKQYSF
uniref:Uncharacterized protein n=1 Tax=Arundo donax TaxID=35708 RepID=A0A0A9DCZ9_ARUDO